MTFDKMIEYQNIDAKLVEFEKQFAANTTVATYKADVNFINQATQQITAYKTKAEMLSNQYDKLVAELNEINADIDEYKSLDSTEDVKQIEYYIKNLNNLLSQIAVFEKELIQIKNEIATTIEGHNKLFAEGVKKSREKKAIQEQFNAINGKYMQGKKEFETKLAQIRPAIPQIFIDKYDALKKDGKLPAFVEYDPNNKGDMCPRCRMEISYDVKKNLKKSGDFFECPNCHRILYIK